jgi:hypothetical protein
MNNVIAFANCVKGMESELIELRVLCKKQKEELEKYRTKERLEILSQSSVTNISTGTIDDVIGDYLG